jgi:hypothetical protein
MILYFVIFILFLYTYIIHQHRLRKTVSIWAWLKLPPTAKLITIVKDPRLAYLLVLFDYKNIVYIVIYIFEGPYQTRESRNDHLTSYSLFWYLLQNNGPCTVPNTLLVLVRDNINFTSTNHYFHRTEPNKARHILDRKAIDIAASKADLTFSCVSLQEGIWRLTLFFSGNRSVFTHFSGAICDWSSLPFPVLYHRYPFQSCLIRMSVELSVLVLF